MTSYDYRGMKSYFVLNYTKKGTESKIHKKEIKMATEFTRTTDTILIVEDIKENYEILQAFLDEINVACENARDGLEAITMCSSRGSDYYKMILMDINLPLMNGIETAEKLHGIGVNVPMIAVTAASRSDDLVKKAAEIFDSILLKPFDYVSLYDKLSPYLPNAFTYTLPATEADNPADKKEELTADIEICNVELGISNMGNSPKLFKKHFKNFKINNVDIAIRLKDLVEAGKYKEAAVLCHSTRGVAGMLALTSIHSDMALLEDALKGKTQLSRDELTTVCELITAVADNMRLVCQIQF